MNLSELLQDITRIYEIASIRCKNPDEFRELVRATGEVFNSELSTLIAYTLINNIKNHPEYIKVLVDELKQANLLAALSDCSEYPSVITLVILNALRHGFITCKDAAEVAKTILQTYPNSHDSVARTVQKMMTDFPISTDDRVEFYKLLGRYLSFDSPEIAGLVLEDYMRVSDADRHVLARILVESGTINSSVLSSFSSHSGQDSYIEFVFDIFRQYAGDSYHMWNIIRYAGLLPESTFGLLLEKIRSLGEDFFAGKSYYARFLGFLAGVIENFRVDGKELDDLAYIIPCLDEKTFWRLYDCCDGSSAYTAALLNNSAITTDRDRFFSLLKLYLQSPVATRKKHQPSLQIDGDIIKKLSPQMISELISRSYREERKSGEVVPVRFTYTNEAIQLIRLKITPLLVTRKVSAEYFEKFLSLYRKEDNHARAA